MQEQQETIPHPELAQEILRMVEEDQAMRKSDEWNDEVDRKNTERMKEVIQEFGWPYISVVGKDASHGAWLLAQHADKDVAFQKQVLELFKDALAKGEVEKKDYAMLYDRVAVNSGEPQLFGTQFHEDENGVFGARPIAERDGLEARRLEYGFKPFAEYEKHMIELNRKFKEETQRDGK